MSNYDIDREREEYEYNNAQPNELELIKNVGIPNVTSIINGIVNDVEIGRVNPLDAFAILRKWKLSLMKQRSRLML